MYKRVYSQFLLAAILLAFAVQPVMAQYTEESSRASLDASWLDYQVLDCSFGYYVYNGEQAAERREYLASWIDYMYPVMSEKDVEYCLYTLNKVTINLNYSETPKEYQDKAKARAKEVSDALNDGEVFFMNGFWGLATGKSVEAYKIMFSYDDNLDELVNMWVEIWPRHAHLWADELEAFLKKNY